jgi:hypothetical protein
VAIVLFAVLSLWAEFMSLQPGDTGTAGNIVVVPALLALTSIVLGWIAFASRQDRSYALVTITLALSFQTLVVFMFEVLEVLL